MMILPRRGSDRVPDSVVLVILVVAASLGTVFAKDTAFVEVVLFESSPNGDYTTYTTGLQGRFSKAGATISAEGEIVQIILDCVCTALLIRTRMMRKGNAICCSSFSIISRTPNRLSCSEMSRDALRERTSASDFQRAHAVS
ncbi:E3 ubiquitin-protein ligase ZNRF3 isoform X1, partial [Lates japonicus]